MHATHRAGVHRDRSAHAGRRDDGLRAGKAAAASIDARARGRPGASSIGGYATFGNINFTATESFDAILGSTSGPDLRRRRARRAAVGRAVRGRRRVAISRRRRTRFRVRRRGDPARHSRRRHRDADRNQRRLAIPRSGRMPKLTPYVAGGLTSMKYQETSDVSTPAEDVDDTFSGYHLLGGAEYKITRWLGVAGEASGPRCPTRSARPACRRPSTKPTSAARRFRFKITIGR